MVPLDKLDQITRRFEFLEAKLAAGAPPAEIAPLSREYSELKPVVDAVNALQRVRDGCGLGSPDEDRQDPVAADFLEEQQWCRRAHIDPHGAQHNLNHGASLDLDGAVAEV